MTNKTFGSGYFGEWIEDEHGLPAYRYTCDQINDAKAITPMNELWRAKTDHLHQVGNDRLVGVASNYGYIQVRQDEGSPKFLNEYDPKNGQYAGGLGYLTDGKDILSTFYPGSGESFDRIFGIGYFRKTVSGNGLSADQVIFAPFGDDPLLISQVTITNSRNDPVDLRWIEYWGCWMYQFSIKTYGKAIFKKNISLTRELRREFSKEFTRDFKLLDNNSGLLELKAHESQKEIPEREYPRAVMEDKNPPNIFLLSLDSPADAINSNGAKFFGNGGVESPEGIKVPLANDISNTDLDSAMLIERKIHLNAGESTTLYFSYGYLPKDFEIDTLINKYKKDLANLWIQSSKSWKKDRIELKIPNESWVDRELTWHNYYLRSAMTYDSYFREHILSQGHVYQYIIGFQGASRDPLQHVMPFIYSQPEIVKEILRYTLKTIDKNGEIPYGITGSGKIMPAPFKPSDLEMWLLWCCSEYILVTRDTEFLEEIIPSYPIYKRNSVKAPVKDVLLCCYKHFTEICGVGKHGLQRLSNGDWNDAAVIGHVPEEKHNEVRKLGESVLNAAMATYTLDIYAEMLDFLNDKEPAKLIHEYANTQRSAVKAQWMGKWFRRGWLTEEYGWFGEDQLWLEPQPWAIIGGSADLEQCKTLVKSINELVRTSKIGARLVSKGIEMMWREVGMRVNGGIWPSINGTLIWALSLVDEDMAWDEWKKNTLAVHAESFPDVWYGIWSGPDTYNSDISKYPGQTHFCKYWLTKDPKDEQMMKEDLAGAINWTDFPVMNLHPHAWPIYNTINLIGLKATKDGLEFAPSLPKDEYKFSSPLVGFEKSKEGYSGWYAPNSAGSWKIIVKLSNEEINRYNKIEINNKEETIVKDGNKIVFSGTSAPDEPLSWKIKK
ncbi:MAG: GH36-type glycosyl hydrolase domain-containing protein [Promethearchaeota archaeon]